MDLVRILLSSLVLSTLLVALMWLALRSRIHPAWLLLPAIAPFAIVYLASPASRVYSTHGFMHLGIVYQIEAGNVPPNSPLLGEAHLNYPWLNHYFVARLIHWFDVSPATLFALCNLLCLALTLVLLYRAALVIDGDRTAAVFAASLAVFGNTLFNVGPFAVAFRRLIDVPVSEGRALAALKYLRLNNMPVGLVFFALFLYAGLRIFARREQPGWADYLLLAIAILGSGWLYPPTWLALMGSLGIVTAAFALRQGRAGWPRLIAVCAWSGIAVLAVMPYLNSFRTGTESVLSVETTVWSMSAKGVRLALGLLPVALLALWKRDTVRGWMRKQPDGIAALAWIVATCGLMYVVLDTKENEYKYLILSCFTLGVMAGGLHAAIFRQHRVIWAVVSVMFLAAACSDWIFLWESRHAPVADAFVDSGRYIRHADPAQASLYEWIGTRTPGNAVVIDSYLTMPVFGRRALYAGLDMRRDAGAMAGMDGWNFTAGKLLWQEGHRRELVQARTGVAKRILDAAGPLRDADVLELERTNRTRPVYVVSRTAAVTSRLAGDPRFVETFSSGAGAVFRLRP
jgi:hypothetical protein